MRFLITIPLYGTTDGLRKLFPTLGVPYPGDDAFPHELNFFPFAHGELLVRNNNIENVGFTRAVNDGMRASLQRGYDAVWVMGDDMQVLDIEAAVRDIEREFAEHPKTGIVGIQLRDMQNPDFIYHGGTKQSYPAGVHKTGFVSKGDLNTRTRERWVAGGTMVVRSACMREIGLMDERFFLICSDSDYCFRARAAGFDVVYLPVPLLHRSGGITEKPSKSQTELLGRDILQFSRKWITGEAFRYLEEEPL